MVDITTIKTHNNDLEPYNNNHYVNSNHYSDFQILHSPYAIPAYAAIFANGDRNNTMSATAIIAAPSIDVLSDNLSLIQVNISSAF